MSRTLLWDKDKKDFYRDPQIGGLVLIDGQDKLEQDLEFALTTRAKENDEWGMQWWIGDVSDVVTVKESIYQAVDWLVESQQSDPYLTSEEEIASVDWSQVTVEGTDVTFFVKISTAKGQEVSVSKTVSKTGNEEG